MSISVDPVSLIKDYIENRREKNDLEKIFDEEKR